MTLPRLQVEEVPGPPQRRGLQAARSRSSSGALLKDRLEKDDLSFLESLSEFHGASHPKCRCPQPPPSGGCKHLEISQCFQPASTDQDGFSVSAKCDIGYIGLLAADVCCFRTPMSAMSPFGERVSESCQVLPWRPPAPSMVEPTSSVVAIKSSPALVHLMQQAGNFNPRHCRV